MKERVYYFDRLRLIAAFAVVTLHISGAGLFDYGIGSFEWSVCNIFDSVSRFAVPVFVMISGAVFLNPQREYTTRNIFRKYIMRICVAFVVWSAFYAVVRFDGDIKSFIENIISGHYHMWYLYMLFGLYLCVPMLRKITESDALVKYFLILSVVFTFALKFIARLPHMGLIQTVEDKASFNFAVGYVSYFVGGYYLNKIEISKFSRCIIYLIGLCSFAATALLTQIISIKSGAVYDVFYSYFSPTVLLQSIAVFVFAKYNFSHSPKTSQRVGLVSALSELTFGIYLIHPYIIELIARFKTENSVLSFPVAIFAESLVVFVISGAVVYLLRKVSFLRKAL